MRDAVFNALFERMARDERVWFVTADVGLGIVERFKAAYPDRYLNVGVAEQNMVGVAAGLCASGYRPVLYSISNFAIHRCFEQLRDDAALHGYPLVILGTTTGFDNATLGPTHHVVDDWGAARNLPGLEVHCPATKDYARAVLDDVMGRGAFAYVRIPKGGGVNVTYLPGDTGMVTLMTYGGMAAECFKAHGLAPAMSVTVLQKLHPIGALIIPRRGGRLVVVEDHFADTGLYSSVCQLAARHRLDVDIISRAPSGYYREAGDNPAHFWKKFRGDAESLAQDFG